MKTILRIWTEVLLYYGHHILQKPCLWKSSSKLFSDKGASPCACWYASSTCCSLNNLPHAHKIYIDPLSSMGRYMFLQHNTDWKPLSALLTYIGFSPVWFCMWIFSVPFCKKKHGPHSWYSKCMFPTWVSTCFLRLMLIVNRFPCSLHFLSFLHTYNDNITKMYPCDCCKYLYCFIR